MESSHKKPDPVTGSGDLVYLTDRHLSGSESGLLIYSAGGPAG
ncbi:hypothetical protein VRK_11120 [Vibrio sp. MEBiC08052]|nr:hypothetical protein VRK_11120 [Vibrio sp. MEBiC08052]